MKSGPDEKLLQHAKMEMEQEILNRWQLMILVCLRATIVRQLSFKSLMNLNINAYTIKGDLRSIISLNNHTYR